MSLRVNCRQMGSGAEGRHRTQVEPAHAGDWLDKPCFQVNSEQFCWGVTIKVGDLGGGRITHLTRVFWLQRMPFVDHDRPLS